MLYKQRLNYSTTDNHVIYRSHLEDVMKDVDPNQNAVLYNNMIVPFKNVKLTGISSYMHILLLSI